MIEQFVRRPQGLWLRKAIFQVHLWTGIAMGLYVVAVSVSGSALFFRSALNEATPGRKVVAGSGPLLTKAELIAAAKRAYPDYVPGSVSTGTTPGREVEITLDRGTKRKVRVFDPYTGRDLGEAVPYSLQLMSWLLNLHVNLLAGSTGRIVNGVCAILLTLLSLTGAVIWWPGIKNWRRSLTINLRGNWKRINWDLHSAVGFWTFAFFFMWSFTGIYLVFPGPFEMTINRLAPLEYYRLITLQPEPSLQIVNIVRVADGAPQKKRKRKRPEIHYSTGDQIIRTFLGAHFGNFGGMGTRILWAAIGLAPPFLFATGALMWWNRVLSREGRPAAPNYCPNLTALGYGMIPGFLAAILGILIAIPASAKTPIPVKVVVITMFERGADAGDQPGELQYWVERNHLDRVIPFAQGFHNLRMNRDGVLAVLTGVGTAKSAAAIMALGMDPRFDLTKAYWLVAGIAGINPARGSLGSAAWAEWVVDGDLAREIDAREIPSDWKTGYLPLRGSVPYAQPRDSTEGEVYHLNPGLVDWAFQLTEHVPLADSEAMQAARNPYSSVNARRPPFVMKGDTLSSGTFWHGNLLNEWAIDWVQYHTGGKGDFVTTAMEDTGTLQSLTFLARAGRADLNRILVLRTASNFDLPPPGVTAAENLARTELGKYSAYLPALEAAWRVGNTVVEELVRNWSRYRETTPAAKR